MRDFTVARYYQLLIALQNAGYQMIAFEDYLNHISNTEKEKTIPDKFVILRHDIDLRAPMALPVAETEREVGARASYYFRCIPDSNKPKVIRSIAEIGMEIGYHYEDMSVCNGDSNMAIQHFEHWLGYFRQFYPVITICMHGAPQFKHDSRDLWKTADYRDYGIIGEPYFDTDFSDVVYLTDTGRRWDGYKVSVRDKIPEHQDRWSRAGWVYHTTDDIISAAQNNTLPHHLMLTTHPQRWTDNLFMWSYEYLRQSFANIVKWLIVSRKRKNVVYHHA